MSTRTPPPATSGGIPTQQSLEDLSHMMEHMHGVVNLDAASALLQGLLQHIGRQNVFMLQLQDQVQQMIPRREHDEVILRLEQKIVQLEQDLIKVQRASTANLLDQQ